VKKGLKLEMLEDRDFKHSLFIDTYVGPKYPSREYNNTLAMVRLPLNFNIIMGTAFKSEAIEEMVQEILRTRRYEEFGAKFILYYNDEILKKD